MTAGLELSYGMNSSVEILSLHRASAVSLRRRDQPA